MKNQPRIDVTNSKYGIIDDYTSEQLSELSSRNVITIIIDILIKIKYC